MVVIFISFLHMPSNPECSVVLQFHHRHANKASNFLAFKALKIQMPDAPISRKRPRVPPLRLNPGQIITIRDEREASCSGPRGWSTTAYNVTEIVPPPSAVTSLEMQLSLTARAIFSGVRRRRKVGQRWPRGHRALAASLVAIIIIYRASSPTLSLVPTIILVHTTPRPSVGTLPLLRAVLRKSNWFPEFIARQIFPLSSRLHGRPNTRAMVYRYRAGVYARVQRTYAPAAYARPLGRE